MCQIISCSLYLAFVTSISIELYDITYIIWTIWTISYRPSYEPKLCEVRLWYLSSNKWRMIMISNGSEFTWLDGIWTIWYALMSNHIIWTRDNSAEGTVRKGTFYLDKSFFPTKLGLTKNLWPSKIHSGATVAENIF